MEEIAKEYDVIVLGTGTSTKEAVVPFLPPGVFGFNSSSQHQLSWRDGLWHLETAALLAVELATCSIALFQRFLFR